MNFNVQSFLDDFHRAAMAMGFQHEVMARVGGYEIPAYSKKKEEGCGRIYLSSGCHGDEPAGPYSLLEMMNEGFFDDGIEWLICPLLNPTGMMAGTRENAQGVDLNRDYFKKVSVEVSGHAEWLEAQRVPDMFLSLHEDWESTGFYLYEIQKNVCKSMAQKILGAVSNTMPIEPNDTIDGHEVREQGWIFHQTQADVPDQWPEAIFMAERGATVSYTLETPSSRELKERVRSHKLAVQCAVRELLLTHGG